MAPLVRGSSSRGSRRGRGTVRGRGIGRGRGRSRRGKWSGSGDRSTFYSTRIEEDVGSDAETPGGSQDSENDGDEDGSQELSSASEDEEATAPSAKSYNSLLKSFNSNIQRGPAKRKKRKTDHEEVQEESSTIENSLEEAEKGEASDTGSEEGEELLNDGDDEDLESLETAEQSKHKTYGSCVHS